MEDQPGPFKPDHPDAHLNKNLTKCRHCSWFVRLERYRVKPSSRDWCSVCGRVASEKDLEKQQVESANSTWNEADGSYLLGQKEIPFRINAHDPRLFEKYKPNWEENGSDNSGWQYDDAEREEEVFLHRIGKSPTFSNILNSIPHVANDNIPNEFKTSQAYSTGLSHWDMQDTTDAIIIENPQQLQFVSAITSLFDSRQKVIQITASWDKESRCGIFKFRFMLPKQAFLGQSFSKNWLDQTAEQFAVILGLWYGLFPLQLSDLCGRLNGSSSEEIINELEESPTFDIQVKPYKVKLEDVIDDLREKLPSRVGSILSDNNVNKSRFAMAPSDGSRFSGGSCSHASSSSFRDSIVRYFSERFVSLLPYNCSWRQNDLVATCIGATRRRDFELVDAILGYQIAVTAGACFRSDASNRPCSFEPSIKDIMVRVENLGHESEDCVEGLKIELLDFQLQSLKWALERERAPGGIQSFIWPKLPTSGGQGQIYYNPILKSFRKDKPTLVRGGFIAEQMGLGKTVISLALILKNPAPEFPLSGSPISELKRKDPSKGASENCCWEKELYKKTSVLNKKTGSIICRGTLVICPVSLVGQWIEEAKSKLKDPGLIYPYHGPKRKRDAKKLSANSIVVTTYDILASDAFHHSKNYGTGYCPPLQQIRWWRIICDEGHSLRDSKSRRSKAVLSLVSDNKWIVTGTSSTN